MMHGPAHSATCACGCWPRLNEFIPPCLQSALVRLTVAGEPESDPNTGLQGPGALNMEAAVNALEVCRSMRRCGDAWPTCY